MILNQHTGELPTSAKRSRPKRVISRDHFIRIGQLTPRQHEVMELVAKGMTQDDIAALLKVRPAVVNHHMFNVRAIYGARTTAEAVAMWSREQVTK